MIKEIDVFELKKLIEEESIQLIDVRNQDEYDFTNIGGELIVLNEVPNQVDKISREGKVAVLCRSGVRSANAIEFLQSHHGFENLYNVKGGILAWAEHIDATIKKY